MRNVTGLPEMEINEDKINFINPDLTMNPLFMKKCGIYGSGLNSNVANKIKHSCYIQKV